MITAVITCMGRLDHLKTSLPFALEVFDRVIVVDWSCPQQSGDWAAKNGASVTYRYNEPYFNGSKAKNCGAELVNSDYIAFVDADSICMPNMRTELHELCAPHRMILSARNIDGTEVNDTVGFLVCPTDSFWEVGGFDESWVGWGHEDIHLRGKLFLQAKLEVSRLSLFSLGAIAHSNVLRSQNREEPIETTAVKGFKRLAAWFEQQGIPNFSTNPIVKDIVFAGTPAHYAD